MPTVGSKKISFVCDIVQTDSWVVSYPRKLWTPGVKCLFFVPPVGMSENIDPTESLRTFAILYQTHY